MKLNVETPERLIDINRLPLDKIEATPDGGLKIGATVRNSDLAHHPTVQRDYAVLSQALLSRRVGAASQHGHDRRQPAAAHALRVLPRHRDAVQQARAGDAAARRSPAAIARSRSSARATIASRPTRPTCASRWRRSKRRFTCRDRRAHARSRSATFTCCPATRRTRDRARAGRPDHARYAAAAGAGSKQVYLKLRDRASYEFALASAAVVLTVAGGNVTPCAHRAGRRRHEALAVAGSRGRARRPAGRPQRTSARRPMPPCATRSRRARTASRSSWRSAASRTRCKRRRPT